ncbi:MAG: GNAT family N-acetyltransferase [Bacillota bacterium]|nr:GNAT family N-acetyltransferase [Bacillota bacterium]
MIKQIDLSDILLVGELYQMQKASYLIEARLIGFFEIPPLKETIQELIDCNETFIGYFEKGELAGALSYIAKERELTICRMFVHPTHFRKGIARKLLVYLEEMSFDITTFIVSTGKDNVPAKSLYLEFGFQFIRDHEVVSGFFISFFEKNKQHQDYS